MDRTPSCPKCGSQDVTVIGSHPMFAAGADRGREQPTSTNFAYKCACGLGFTDVVKHEGKPESDRT